MDKYSYKDVIIDPADPRVEIGKEYWFGDAPGELLANSNKDKPNCHGVLHDVGEDGEFYPFCVCVDGVNYIEAACLIRKKEPEKKYVPFDLSKPEVRDSLRGKWIRRKPYTFNPSYCLEVTIDCFEQVDEGAEGVDSIYWTANGINSHELFEDWTFLDGTPCGQKEEE